MADEKDEKKGLGELAHRALGPAADEFSKGFEGGGESFGRSAKSVAESLESAVGGVEWVLSRFQGLVAGFGEIKEKIQPGLIEKLKNVPDERRQMPDPKIAGPALEALRFTVDEDELRGMFENLLANAIDQKTAESAHPSFVEVLKQITTDEAKILRYLSRSHETPIIDIRLRGADSAAFWLLQKNISCVGEYAGCENPNLVPASIDNLCRLGICSIPANVESKVKGFYDQIDNHPEVTEKKAALKNAMEEGNGNFPLFLKGMGMLPSIQELRIVTNHKILEHTSYGRQFMASCVVPKK